jgi:hypothetical protein
MHTGWAYLLVGRYYLAYYRVASRKTKTLSPDHIIISVAQGNSTVVAGQFIMYT